MQAAYDPKAPKRATNLSINSDLLRIAKKLDINLSATLEGALVGAVKSEQRKRWLTENRDAMVAYNEHVETYKATCLRTWTPGSSFRFIGRPR